MSRLKILAIAYACDPARGSEFGVGWGWVNAIAAGHDITVITADYNAPSIDRYLQNHQDISSNTLRFHYVKNHPWHYCPSGIWLNIEHSLFKPLMNLAYQDWLRYAFEEAQLELKKNRYDLVHLITYVGWRFPGNFYRLGIPFVWGPIGGMKNTPWRLLPILGYKGTIYYGARNLINTIQLAILPGPRRALRSAKKGVIAATSEIQCEIQNRFGAASHVICEVGPPEIPPVSLGRRNESDPFTICWSGQHQPGKALHLLLNAAALLPSDFDFHIEILGDGPSSEGWKSLASKLGIQDRCHWLGWIPRDQSLEVMRDSHVFVITSLKDLTSNVSVEAISLGLPVICLDHCGFADLVTEQCGIKVLPGSERQIVTDLANALRRLYQDECLRLALAEGALRRKQFYSWTSKMATLDQIYADVISDVSRNK